MNRQIMFNMLLKQNLFELGGKLPSTFRYVDLNGYAVREKDIEEFKKLTLIESK